MLLVFDYSIDASANDSMGRLVNDNHISPNACMKLLSLKRFDVEEPHLCLFATCTIDAGTEIRYDYGPGHYPWRKVSSA